MAEAALASFVRPGPYGRLVRAAFGLLFAWMLLGTLQGTSSYWNGGVSWEPLQMMGLLVVVFLTTYMVNGTFGVSWGDRVTAGLVLVGVALVVLTALTESLALARLYWAFVWVWMATVATIFASAFFLAAGLGTPGCELNAFRHLVKGDTCSGRACMALIDKVDQWEGARRAPEPAG